MWLGQGSDRGFVPCWSALYSYWILARVREAEGKVGLCNALRLSVSVLTSSLLSTSYKKAQRRLEISFPKMYVPFLCLFLLQNANVLKNSASCLIILNQPNDQTSVLMVGKIFLWGRDREGKKGCLFERAELGYFGQLQGAMSSPLKISEGLKNKRAKTTTTTILLICQLGWGLVSFLDIGVRTGLKGRRLLFPPEFSLAWASTVSTVILPHVWEVGR